jgi:hypothetical protein
MKKDCIRKTESKQILKLNCVPIGCFRNSGVFLQCIVLAFNKGKLVETAAHYSICLVLNKYKV